MSEIFADVFEAIKHLRQEKGATKKAIVKHIKERTGSHMSMGKLVKAMDTISRLIDEGVLVKKGKRVVFPRAEGDNEEENEKGSCEAEAENDEGEEDDDEDNDEEDEEGNDDQDDNCQNDEDNNDDDDDDNSKGNGEGKPNCEGNNNDNNNSNENNGGGNACDDEGLLLQDDYDDWNYRYLGSRLKKYMKSELNPVKYTFRQSKKPIQRTRMNRLFDGYARGQSPMGHRPDINMMMMMDMDSGLPEDIAFSCNEGNAIEDINNLRYRSPNGPPPPNTPGVHVERKESCCSDVPAKVDDVTNMEPDTARDMKLAKNESDSSRQSVRTKERYGKRREKDDENNESGEEAPFDDKTETSWCPRCKKKMKPEDTAE